MVSELVSAHSAEAGSENPSAAIAPVPLDLKWQLYKAYCMNYAQVLKDVASVCQTLRAFIRESLSGLEHLSPNQIYRGPERVSLSGISAQVDRQSDRRHRKLYTL